MDKKEVAQDLVRLAKSLVGEEKEASSRLAGRGSREFQSQIDAISAVQAFIEDEAKSWDALSGRTAQTNLKRASVGLSNARNELYYAWENRDKTKAV